MTPPVLSYVQAAQILAALDAHQAEATVSLDLGLTTSRVALDPGGALLPNGRLLTRGELGLIADAPRSCFQAPAGGLPKIQIFSEEDERLYSLMPTEGAPTLLVSGISMHRIKGVDPHGDAVAKVRAVAPVAGRVLDTSTGLGYTAIEAARTAQHVTTMEINPACLAIARLNPWSRALFESANITQVVGDATEEIQHCPDRQFQRIIHDPPSLSMAGEMYSTDFYRQLFRVLQSKGRLFHYIGDIDAAAGRNSAIARGAMRRLQEAGFKRVVRNERAFGLVAYKD